MAKRSEFKIGDLIISKYLSSSRRIATPLSLKEAIRYKDHIYIITSKVKMDNIPFFCLEGLFNDAKVKFPKAFMNSNFLNFGKPKKGFKVLWFQK